MITAILVVTVLILAGVGVLIWLAWGNRKRLDWQHDTIVPWIYAVNEKLGLPK